MILAMKKIPLTKKIILKCSPHQYWGAWKKIKFVKIFHLLSSTWTLFFNLPQILGSILVLASRLKKHDQQFSFWTPCKQELRNNVPNFFLLSP